MKARTRALVIGTSALIALGLVACSPEEETSTDGTSEGTEASGDAYETLIAEGPVADDATIEANEWASAVKESGALRVGGTETSELFSLLDVTTNKARGFDAAISQLLAQYILGEPTTELTQVTVDTREELLVNDNVDVVFATYSITPERAERIDFAGPYYQSQAAILVKEDNADITSLEDLAGKKVATQANSTGQTLLETEAPEAEILALPDHAQALASVIDGNADAYVIDQTLLLNAVLANEGEVKIVGDPFGPSDLYGIGLQQGGDGAEFINAFLTQIIEDGTWDKVWTLTIGDRTGVETIPAPPVPGETGLS